VNYPVATNPFDIGLAPMTQTQVSFAQMIPAPGTFRLQEELARWDVKIESINLEEKELLIASLVRKAFVQLSLNSTSLEIVESNKQVLSQFLDISESKYKAGNGILQDVLQARVALSRIDLTISELEQQIRTSKALLNTILDRDPDTPLAAAPAIAKSSPPVDYTAIMLSARENRPVLKALEAGVEKSTISTRLAEKRLNPDYTLRFAYGYRYDATDFWTAGISFNLPLWRGSKQREVIAQSEARQRVARAQLLAKRNDIAYEARKALDEIARTEEQLNLYDTGVIPQAQMSLKSSIAGYQVDKVDFLTMLNSQKMLYDLELERVRVLAQHELSVVDLDTAAGVIPGIRTTGEFK
jgi:cobalt-zinc-cadmium efflux system outer membrane protein